MKIRTKDHVIFTDKHGVSHECTTGVILDIIEYAQDLFGEIIHIVVQDDYTEEPLYASIKKENYEKL